MANDYNNKTNIRNGGTLARREWIETALASVKQKMDVSTFLPSTLESAGHDLGRELGTELAPEVAAEAPRPQRGDRPHLYLAWSDGPAPHRFLRHSAPAGPR